MQVDQRIEKQSGKKWLSSCSVSVLAVSNTPPSWISCTPAPVCELQSSKVVYRNVERLSQTRCTNCTIRMYCREHNRVVKQVTTITHVKANDRTRDYTCREPVRPMPLYVISQEVPDARNCTRWISRTWTATKCPDNHTT